MWLTCLIAAGETGLLAKCFDIDENRDILPILYMYTASPSEPMFALAAGYLLHKCGFSRWAKILESFSTICEEDIVEKGQVGEITARVLLILARDFAAPVANLLGRAILKPIRLVTFFQVLFGKKDWGMGVQQEFDEAFKDAHISFTHWILTKDAYPEKLDL